MAEQGNQAKTEPELHVVWQHTQGECLEKNPKDKATRKQSQNSAELWQAHGFMTVAVSR